MERSRWGKPPWACLPSLSQYKEVPPADPVPLAQSRDGERFRCSWEMFKHN